MHGQLTKTLFQKSQEFISSLPKEEKKELGQFTTSPETAKYMASMFSIPDSESISILDPGAGSGILSAAVIDRLLEQHTVKELHLTCYENDSKILPLLTSNIEEIVADIGNDVKFTYEIKTDNYILSNSDSFNGVHDNNESYDIVISNPPYKKISKNDPEAVCMEAVCSGAPNKYFIFMAISIHQLKANGQLVYIIPRSWTSGKYFKAFREYLLSNCTIKQLHIFVSRNKVFESESVLQETMIVKATKGATKEPILITSSENNHDYGNLTSLSLPYDNVIQGKEQYVFLITSEDESHVIKKIGMLSQTLPDIGIRMKTGIVVDFRSKEYIVDGSGEGRIPYFQAAHINRGSISFPKTCTEEYLLDSNASLIQPNQNYLFVKRFTTKEEKRRLQTAIYLSNQFSDYSCVATDNKINFVTGVKNGLSTEEVYGLYVIFNSTIYDQYYRILNGSTQVNSSEVNSMPVPTRGAIRKMGADLMRLGDLTTKSCDDILGAVIDG